MSPITTAKQKSSFRPQGAGNANTNSASRSPVRVDAPSHTYKGTDPKSAISYNKAQLKTK